MATCRSGATRCAQLDLPLPPRRMPRAAPRAPAEALALRRRLRARADAVRRRRARRRRAAALVGGGAAGRAAVRGLPAPTAAAIELVARREGPASRSSPAHGRSYIWTRKQAGIPVLGHGPRRRTRVAHRRPARLRRRVGRLPRPPHDLALVGRASGAPATAAAVAWNLVDGVHDAPRGERAHGLGRRRAARGRSRSRSPRTSRAVGDLRFTEWSAREDHTNRLVMRSDYRQPFGVVRRDATGRARAGVGLRRDGVARRALVGDADHPPAGRLKAPVAPAVAFECGRGLVVGATIELDHDTRPRPHAVDLDPVTACPRAGHWSAERQPGTLRSVRKRRSSSLFVTRGRAAPCSSALSGSSCPGGGGGARGGRARGSGRRGAAPRPARARG